MFRQHTKSSTIREESDKIMEDYKKSSIINSNYSSFTPLLITSKNKQSLLSKHSSIFSHKQSVLSFKSNFNSDKDCKSPETAQSLSKKNNLFEGLCKNVTFSQIQKFNGKFSNEKIKIKKNKTEEKIKINENFIKKRSESSEKRNEKIFKCYKSQNILKRFLNQDPVVLSNVTKTKEKKIKVN